MEATSHLTSLIWLRQRVAELGGGVLPEGDGDLDLGERGLVRATVSHTAGQIGGFSDEDLILIAPADGDRVLMHEGARSGLGRGDGSGCPGRT